MLLGLLTLVGGAAAQTPSGAVGVYYIGPEDDIAAGIRAAAPNVVLVDRPSLAGVLVLNNTLLNTTDLPQETQRYFTAQIQKGSMGLVLFSGPNFPRAVSDLGDLLGVSTFGMARETRPTILRGGEAPDSLRDAIAWNSAPVIGARTVISNPNLLDPVVVTAQGAPVLQRLRGHQTAQVFLVGMWLDDPSNAQWRTWPYMRYLIYRLIAEAGGVSRPHSFASYPGDPVPQGHGRQALLIGGGALLILAWGVFFFARRYVFLHPQAADQIQIPRRTTRPPSLWEHVGFHRPLAGFFILATGVLFLFPYLAYRVELLPRWLLPWGQTLTFWDQVTRWAALLNVLLDAGIGYATVYFFVPLRGSQPRAAFRYLQFYVWWQLLSGMVFLGIIALLAAVLLPNTPLAHVTYPILLHALFQFPGFLGVFALFFRAIQRQDDAQTLTLFGGIGGVIFQVVAVLLLRRWGATQPIGEPLGGLIGLGLGSYLAALLTFLIGATIYRWRGYTLRAMFLPNFDSALARRVLGFGLLLVLGDGFAPLGLLILATKVPGWITTDGSVYTLADILPWLTLGFLVLARGLYDGLFPALVEARSREYKTLLRYYVSQGLHYGAWFSFFLLAGLGAIMPQFFALVDRGLVPQAALWQQAILLWAAFQWLSWSAERVLIAAGHPLLRTMLNLLEQAIGIGSTLYFVPTIGMWSLVPALGGALLIKALLAWAFIKREVVSPRFLPFQSVIVPAVSAAILYQLLRLLPWDTWPGVWLSVPAMSLALLLHAFLTSFLGGWEEDGITELRRAASISGLGKPLAWLILLGVRSGSWLSPLHRREPVALREMAEEEAWALTQRQHPPE